jgi:hypothetical protein
MEDISMGSPGLDTGFCIDIQSLHSSAVSIDVLYSTVFSRCLNKYLTISDFLEQFYSRFFPLRRLLFYERGELEDLRVPEDI